LDTVFLDGISTPTFEYERDSGNFTRLDLELDFFKNETEFTLVGETETYTLTLGYDMQTQFVSDDCGPRYILSNLNVLSHNFPDDSIRVISRSPSTNGGTHIEVYRCPHPDTIVIALKQLTLNPNTATQSSRALSANFDNITVNGTTQGYVGRRAATVYLPVDLSAAGPKASTYTFNFADGFGYEQPQRSLQVNYNVVETERYSTCGIQRFLSGLSIVSEAAPTAFDSVRLITDVDGEPVTTLSDPASTNIEVFRCPVTNLIQMSFRERTSITSTRADSLFINGITTDYNAEVYYAGDSVSVVQLPLNLNANSTTFSIDYKNSEITDIQVKFDYTRTTRDYYRNACGDNQVVITNLTQTALQNVTIPTSGRAIQYPPVNNVNIENNVDEDDTD
jgi:hypothetical protein